MTAPMMPQAPVQTAMMPPKMPWTPFTPLPTDSEPAIATMRMRRLSKMIDSAKFEGFPPEWQATAINEYQRMAQVVASVTPLPPLPKGVTVQEKVGDAGSLAAGEQAAINPSKAPAPTGAPPAQSPPIQGARQ